MSGKNFIIYLSHGLLSWAGSTWHTLLNSSPSGPWDTHNSPFIVTKGSMAYYCLPYTRYCSLISCILKLRPFGSSIIAAASTMLIRSSIWHLHGQPPDRGVLRESWDEATIIAYVKNPKYARPRMALSCVAYPLHIVRTHVSDETVLHQTCSTHITFPKNGCTE